MIFNMLIPRRYALNTLNRAIIELLINPINWPDHKKSNRNLIRQRNKAFTRYLNGKLGRTSNSKLQIITSYSQKALLKTVKSGYSTEKINNGENSKQSWSNQIRQKYEKQMEQILESFIKLKIKQMGQSKLSEEDKQKLYQEIKLKIELKLKLDHYIKQQVERYFTQKMEEQIKQKVEAQIKQNIIKVFTEKVEKELQTAVERRIVYKMLLQDLSKIMEKEKKKENQKENEKQKQQGKKKENQKKLWQSFVQIVTKILQFTKKWGYQILVSAAFIGGLYQFVQLLDYFSNFWFINHPDSPLSYLARRKINKANILDLRGYSYYQKFNMIQDWLSLDFKSELKDFIKDSVTENISSILDKQYSIQKIMVLYGRDGIGKTSGLLNFVVEQMKKTTDRIPVLYICLRSQVIGNTKKKKQSQKQQEKSYIVDAQEILKFNGLDIINLLFNIRKTGHYFQFMQFLKKQGFNINYDSDKKRLILIIDEANALKTYLQKSDPLYHNAEKLIKDLYGLNLSLFQIVVVSSEKQFTQKELVSCSTMRGDKFQLFQIKLLKQDFRKYLELRGSSFELDKDQKALALLTNYYNNKRDVQDILKIYKQAKLKYGEQKAREEIKKSIQKQLKVAKSQLQGHTARKQDLGQDLIQVCLQKRNKQFKRFKHYDYLVDQNIVYDFHFKKLMDQRVFELLYDEIRKEKGEAKEKWTETECKSKEGYRIDYSQKVYLVD